MHNLLRAKLAEVHDKNPSLTDAEIASHKDYTLTTFIDEPGAMAIPPDHGPPMKDSVGKTY